MSPIAGFLSKNGGIVSGQVNSMMKVCDNQNVEGAWVVANKTKYEWSRHDREQRFVDNQALGQVSFATRERPAEQPVFDSSNGLTILYEGDLYNIEELRSRLAPKHKLSGGTAAEVVAHLLRASYRGDLSEALKQVVSMFDGAFCLAASDANQVIVIRDSAGLRPLFYAEGDEFMAFASKKTALWEIGLGNVKPVRGGMLASFQKSGVHIDEACPLSKMGIEVSINELDTAVNGYCTLLKAAVEKRLGNLDKVGVLLSGGVDSCLIAKLIADFAIERGIELTVYTAGVDGAADLDYATNFAQELGLSHKVRKISRDEVEPYLFKVVAAVEERDLVQVEAGIGIYVAAEMACQDGNKVLFSGQGPDELWGGYSWYPEIIARDGYDELQKRMWDDLERGDIETLDRENKIALDLSMESVFPYVDNEIIKLAMSVSPRTKITSANDKIGKRPHRAAAKKLGLSTQYAYRGKNAAQHGSGVHDTLDRIAQKNGFTPELIARIGYRSEEIGKEKLASSTRYGYLYTERKLWQVPDHIQFFFDVMAYKQNLLNDAERAKIEGFLKAM